MNYDKFNFDSRDGMDRIGRTEKMLRRPTSIPGEYLLSGKVKDEYKIFWQFLNLLSNKFGESWWKQESMIKITGLSGSTIKRSIRNLKAAGWLEVSKADNGLTNKYTIIWPETCHNPRIVGAKKNLYIKDLQKIVNREESGNYYEGRNNGFEKVF